MINDLDLVKKLGTYGTATVHEAAGQIGALPGALKPISQHMKLCGPAYPINCLARSNINLHEAIYKASPGDILVASIEGVPDAGYWGDILTCAAQEKGLGGLVIDGCVRDADDIDELNFPIFAKGLNILGTGKERGGSIGQTISIGDITINKGDLIVGDRDGLVVIPAINLQDVIHASEMREQKEDDVRRRLKAGESSLDIYQFS